MAKRANVTYFPVFPSLCLALTKHTRISLLYRDREYKQTKRLFNTTSHFLIIDLVGHLEVFVKLSLVPPMLKIDNFT